MARIAIDVHGQDGPTSIAIEAATNVAKRNKDIEIILVGDQEEISTLYSNNLSNVSIEDAKEKITHEDGILEIRRKPNSSLVKSINLVKEGKADGVVSSGASGPYMAACYLILKTINKDVRPAFAVTLFTMTKGKKFLFLDSGANTEVTSEQLVTFGLIGQVFAKAMGLSDKPIVKLINNGIEEKKGNAIYKEAHQLMKKNKKLNFKGNLEAQNIMDGSADVVVVGGFEGNLIAKTAEGIAKSMSLTMKQEFKRNPKRIFGALVLRKAFKDVKKRFDNRESGGGLILGVNGVAIKTHGSADSYGIEKALELANKLANEKVIEKLKKEFK
jgi:glycerol-3-phosphate acyltransferase PlsX